MPAPPSFTAASLLPVSLPDGSVSVTTNGPPYVCACGCEALVTYWRGGRRLCWGCATGKRQAFLDYQARCAAMERQGVK